MWLSNRNVIPDTQCCTLRVTLSAPGRTAPLSTGSTHVDETAVVSPADAPWQVVYFHHERKILSSLTRCDVNVWGRVSFHSYCWGRSVLPKSMILHLLLVSETSKLLILWIAPFLNFPYFFTLELQPHIHYTCVVYAPFSLNLIWHPPSLSVVHW